MTYTIQNAYNGKFNSLHEDKADAVRRALMLCKVNRKIYAVYDDSSEPDSKPVCLTFDGAVFERQEETKNA